MNRKNIAILGSTGSIGVSTLDVVRRHSDRFRVVSLAAGTNAALLAAQVSEFAPEFASLATHEAAAELKGLVKGPVEIGTGPSGAVAAATHDGVDIVVSAISGAAGLVPTMAALSAGTDVALANKETLVAAGPLVTAEAKRTGAAIMPVDSEHSAVFQSLKGHRREDVKRVILTASGGPFLNAPIESLAGVTPAEALNHPRWKMGRRISVDSATLMNKALEVIEAAFLFDLAPETIDVTIHPQAVVHSMVEYLDGSIIAQMSPPDMKGPIAYALSYPERIEAGVPELDFSTLSLEFSSVDADRFPCLSLAYEALSLGGTAPAVVNAVDEVAVGKFLEGGLPFTGIYGVIRRVLDSHDTAALTSIDDVLEADRWAREKAATIIGCMN